MVRKAFVVGSNGPENYGKLKYAASDADKIAECLSSGLCGFELYKPDINDNVAKVRSDLIKVTSSCSKEDTFVFYFSGHGMLHKGELYFVWDNKEGQTLEISLPAYDVKNIVKLCDANNKLLILDCCHAGAAGMKNARGVPITELNFLPEMKTFSIAQKTDFHIDPSSFLILMASDRLERAKEIDEFKGGFLTTKICEALSSKFELADKDEDNRISINDLKQWLEEATTQHNINCKTRNKVDQQVPCPIIYGQQKGDFFLTLGSPATNPPNKLLIKNLNALIRNFGDKFPPEIRREALRELEQFKQTATHISKRTTKIELLEKLLEHSITTEQLISDWKKPNDSQQTKNTKKQPTNKNKKLPQDPERLNLPSKQYADIVLITTKTPHTLNISATQATVAPPTESETDYAPNRKNVLFTQRTVLFIIANVVFIIINAALNALIQVIYKPYDYMWWHYTDKSSSLALPTVLVTKYVFTKLNATLTPEDGEEKILVSSFDIFLFLILLSITFLTTFFASSSWSIREFLMNLLPHSLTSIIFFPSSLEFFYLPITLYCLANSITTYKKAENKGSKPKILLASLIISLVLATLTIITTVARYL